MKANSFSIDQKKSTKRELQLQSQAAPKISGDRQGKEGGGRREENLSKQTIMLLLIWLLLSLMMCRIDNKDVGMWICSNANLMTREGSSSLSCGWCVDCLSGSNGSCPTADTEEQVNWSANNKIKRKIYQRHPTPAQPSTHINVYIVRVRDSRIK